MQGKRDLESVNENGVFEFVVILLMLQVSRVVELSEICNSAMAVAMFGGVVGSFSAIKGASGSTSAKSTSSSDSARLDRGSGWFQIGRQ